MRHSRAHGRVPAALNLSSSAHEALPGLGEALSPLHATHGSPHPRDARPDLPRPPASARSLGVFPEAPADPFAAFAPHSASALSASGGPPLYLANDRARPPSPGRTALGAPSHSPAAPGAPPPRARSADTTAVLPSPSFPRRPVSAADTRPLPHAALPSAPASPAPPDGALRTPRSASFATARLPYTAAAAAASDQRTQLFVRNLPYSVRWQDVKDLFRRAGTVLRADVHLTSDNRSCGTGTVLFATEDDALRALDALHGYTWQGRVLDVQLERDSLPTSRRSSAAGPASASASAPASQRGSISEEPRTRTPVHAAFPPLGAEALPPPPMPLMSYLARRADASVDAAWPPFPVAPMPPPPAPAALPFPGRVLFIGNLPFHCQWQDLKDLFRAAGNIQRADVALNADGRSRGFGTVLFASPEDAQNAVRLYHGYEFNGRVLKVHFDRLAHYGPASTAVPTDPAQYTAAFAPHAPPPDAALGAIDGETLDVPSPRAAPPDAPARDDAPSPRTVPDAPADAAPAPGPQKPAAAHAARRGSHHGAPPAARRPGRIALPPLPTAGAGAGAAAAAAAATPGLGMPMTPGMPGFIMRPMLDTPPLYPSMLSPGAGPWSPLSPATAPHAFFGGVPPYMNPAPGAPLDYLGGAPPAGYAMNADAGGASAFFPHAGNLPPTPHWSQPARPRAAAPAFTPAALGEGVQPTPGAPQRAAADAPATDEYPFPSVVPPPESTPSAVQSSTKELTDAIAKLSVHGAARSPRATADTGDSCEAAEKAISRLREGLATSPHADASALPRAS